ncbi:MAG: hypothetical protein WCH38_08450, partial [Actinomycetota bacterium]
LSALGAVLTIILMSCGGSSSSSNAGRSKNTKLSDGTICYTPEERSGLVAAAVDVEHQAAVAFQPAVKYRPAVPAQAAVEAQAAIAEEIASQDYEAVAPQPEVAYRAGVPAQPAVPGESEWVESVASGPYPSWRMPYDWSTYIWANTDGGRDAKAIGWVISSTEIMHNGSQLLVRHPGTAGQPAVDAIAEVKYQAAVPGRPAISKGDVLTKAIEGREAQAAVEAQEEVLAQPAVMARDEVQAKTKDEVIAEINQIKDCPDESNVLVVANQVETAHLSDIEYGAGSLSVSILSATDKQISLGLRVRMYGDLCGQRGCDNGAIGHDDLTQVFQVSECAVGSVVLKDYQGNAIDSKSFEMPGAACNVIAASAAEPSLGEVAYEGMKASVNLVVPDGASTEGWKIAVSWPRRGMSTDTGAGSRMHPGDMSASIDLRPNSNGSNCDRETGEFTLLYNDEAREVVSYSYDDAVGGVAPECSTTVVTADPSLGEVAYEGMKASVNLVVPDGASTEGWKIAVSWPRRGMSTDTGAGSRMHPGDMSASIDLRPNSNGSNCDRETGEFTLLYNDEAREVVSYSYDDAVGGVAPECGGAVIENAYFSKLSYSKDMKTAYIEVINPPSTTWGVGYGLCEDGVLTNFNSSNTSYAISGIENCPEGYFVLFDGDQAIDQAVFGIIPSTPQIDHEYSIDVVTSGDGVVGTLLVDGEPCPKEPVAGNPCEDVGVSYSVDYAYWEFDGEGSCDAFIKHCIQQSFSNLRAGTRGYFVASYLSVPTCPCANVSEMFPFEIKGKSDVTVPTVAKPVLPVVSLTDLVLVKDIVMSQVVPADLSEVICLAECVTELQNSAGISGDVFVQVDNGDFIEVRAGSRIALGDSSSVVKVQVRPRDGSAPIDMVVNFNRSTKGLNASDSTSSSIPWFPLGLLIIVLIALYAVKTFVFDKRKTV